MKINFRKSIQARLTIWLGVICLFVFVSSSGLLYWTLQRELTRTAVEELVSKSNMLDHLYTEAMVDGDVEVLKHRLTDTMLGHSELRVWILDSSNNSIYGGTRFPVFSEQLDGFGYSSFVGDDGVTIRGLRTQLGAGKQVKSAVMLLTIDVTQQERLLSWFLNVLAGICIIGIFLAASLGSLTVWHSLRPLRLVSAQAKKITGQNLAIRLPIKDVDVEISELITSFNLSLNLIEQAYKRIEAFNADVAHELRTPLTTLISSTQVVLSKHSSHEELLNCLTENLDDLEQLKKLINNMLFVARADQGEHADELVATELRDEVLKVTDFYDAVLAEKSLKTILEGDERIICNPALIRHAISNLLSNAIKYSPRGETIFIRLDSDSLGIRLAVENSGQPVDSATKERMFDRFFRADIAREKTGHSHGLGLAIVKAIVQMHNGQVFVKSTPNTVVGFILPN